MNFILCHSKSAMKGNQREGSKIHGCYPIFLVRFWTVHEWSKEKFKLKNFLPFPIVWTSRADFCVFLPTPSPNRKGSWRALQPALFSMERRAWTACAELITQHQVFRFSSSIHKQRFRMRQVVFPQAARSSPASPPHWTLEMGKRELAGVYLNI